VGGEASCLALVLLELLWWATDATIVDPLPVSKQMVHIAFLEMLDVLA